MLSGLDADTHSMGFTMEAKRLSKLETMAGKLKRGENLKNRQLQAWLSEHEHVRIEAD